MPIVKYTCAIAPKGAPATEYAFDIPVTEQEMQLARDAKNPEHGKTMNAITTRGQKLVLEKRPTQKCWMCCQRAATRILTSPQWSFYDDGETKLFDAFAHPLCSRAACHANARRDIDTAREYIESIQPGTFNKRLDSCANCEQVDKARKLKCCGGCKIVFYCSRECQVEDWKARHKHDCKQMRENN
mmetsp:Transcript_11392/g.21074  ORF Transcript_11392/g.21074 Transcript_11392/m.21074 type:complete len:186 (-) Transcript_11392:44-601(-)